MLRFVPSSPLALTSPQVALGLIRRRQRAPLWAQHLHSRSPLTHWKSPPTPVMATKRKRSSESAGDQVHTRPRQRTAVPVPTVAPSEPPQPPRRQASRKTPAAVTDPTSNPDILDGLSSLRASPDAVQPPVKLRKGAAANRSAAPHVPAPSRRGRSATTKTTTAEATSDADDALAPGTSRAAVADPDPPVPGSKHIPSTSLKHVKAHRAEATTLPVQNGIAPSGHVLEETVGVTLNPDNNEADLLDEDHSEPVEDLAEALSRPPPVNSDYLPLPWKGRLGYVCFAFFARILQC